MRGADEADTGGVEDMRTDGAGREDGPVLVGTIRWPAPSDEVLELAAVTDDDEMWPSALEGASTDIVWMGGWFWYSTHRNEDGRKDVEDPGAMLPADLRLQPSAMVPSMVAPPFPGGWSKATPDEMSAILGSIMHRWSEDHTAGGAIAPDPPTDTAPATAAAAVAAVRSRMDWAVRNLRDR